MIIFRSNRSLKDNKRSRPGLREYGRPKMCQLVSFENKSFALKVFPHFFEYTGYFRRELQRRQNLKYKQSIRRWSLSLVISIFSSFVMTCVTETDLKDFLKETRPWQSSSRCKRMKNDSLSWRKQTPQFANK